MTNKDFFIFLGLYGGYCKLIWVIATKLVKILRRIMRVLVLGASKKEDRYSNKAIRMLRDYDHEVVAIGNREGEVLDVHISKVGEPQKDIHTLTLYVGPANQVVLYDYILDTHPQRVIFNPGTENPELMDLLKAKEIEVEIACTLVMLRTNQFA